MINLRFPKWLKYSLYGFGIAIGLFLIQFLLQVLLVDNFLVSLNKFVENLSKDILSNLPKEILIKLHPKSLIRFATIIMITIYGVSGFVIGLIVYFLKE